MELRNCGAIICSDRPHQALLVSFRPPEVFVSRKLQCQGETMDSMSMMGGSRSPLFLSASSSSLHLHRAQAHLLPNGMKNRFADAGSCCLPAQPTVAILGSGDFSKCLTIRLLRCGFHVVVGSRHPKVAAQSFPHVVDVTHQEDAVGKASIVFLAIRREHYSVLWDLKHLLEGTHHTYMTLQ